MTAMLPLRSPARKEIVTTLLCSLCALLKLYGAEAGSLSNADFENGLMCWHVVSVGGLTVTATTNESYNRNFSARLSGALVTDTLTTNRLSQEIVARRGDRLSLLGFIKANTTNVDGKVQVRLDGPFTTSNIFEMALSNLSNTNASWRRVKLDASSVGMSDGGFETGTLDAWGVTSDHLPVEVAPFQGSNMLHIGSTNVTWKGWNWSEVVQTLRFNKNDVVDISALMFIEKLSKSTPLGFLVAGFKIEHETISAYSDEDTRPAGSIGWFNLSKAYVIPTNGNYKVRAMIAGSNDTNAMCSVSVYFDNLQVSKRGLIPAPEEFDVTVSIEVIGRGTSATNSVDVYVDALRLAGSTANPQSDDSAYFKLQQEAEAIAGGAGPIPAPDYPPLGVFGYPGNTPGVIKYPAYLEALLSGNAFRPLTNGDSLRITNSIEIFSIGGPAELELDCLQFVSRNSNTEIGDPLLIETNLPPYWQVGSKDGSAAEFGGGPFPSDQLFVLGVSPLSDFPRRLSTVQGQWPQRLRIVSDVPVSALRTFTNVLYDKFLILRSISSAGLPSSNKLLQVTLSGSGAQSVLLPVRSVDLFMGAASESESFGMVDYPNVTYQGGAYISPRAPWLPDHNLIDRDGWYFQAAPRASGVNESLNIWVGKSGQWLPAVLDEALYNYRNASSGLTRMFDADDVFRLNGRARHFMGQKIGHKAIAPDMYGDPAFPQLLEVRGNAYFRVSTYGSGFGGSFRPIAIDPFGLYSNHEDFPLMPKILTRLVPASQTAGSASYARIMALFRSKSNQLFAATAHMDFHAAPEEAGRNGVYMDVIMDIYMKNSLNAQRNGPLSIAQSSMNWRSGNAVGDGSEAHDIDTLLLFRESTMEWRTVELSNPPKGVRHQGLGKVSPGDRVYLLQQDRNALSYGFHPEVGYEKASSFFIELFAASSDQLGALDMSLSALINRTFGETDDNTVISLWFPQDFATGDHINLRYRYRVVNSPGVVIVPMDRTTTSPNGRSMPIEFYASDAEASSPLLADVFYGIGSDGGWVLIEKDRPVPTDNFKVSVDWDTSHVPPAAYYVKVVARRVDGSTADGFAVSRQRINVGGFEFERATNGLFQVPGGALETYDGLSDTLLKVELGGAGLIEESSAIVIADGGGASKQISLNRFIAQVTDGLKQYVNIPWNEVEGVDLSRINSIRLTNLPSSICITSIRSEKASVLIAARILGTPSTNGLVNVESGFSVLSVIDVVNLTTNPIANATVRIGHQYADTATWIDDSRAPSKISYKHKRGERLEGDSEQVLTGILIPPESTITFTNAYQLPIGRPHARSGFIAFRNDPGFGKIQASLRIGDLVVSENESIGEYMIDSGRDLDHDGLPDAWEQEHFGNLAADANDDPDGDGVSNIEELAAGTDPIRGTQRMILRAAFLEGNDSELLLSFDSVPGRSYCTFQHIGILSLEFHVDKLSRPLL